jgi:hypothetical protein
VPFKRHSRYVKVMKNIKIKIPANYSYKFRINPSNQQKDIIDAGFRLNRDVYNFFLRRDIYNDNAATLLYLQEKFPVDNITFEKIDPKNKRKSFLKNGEKFNFDDINKTELNDYVKKFKTDK